MALRSWGAALLLTFLGGGCATPSGAPRVEDLVGTWIGPDGGRIQLLAQGRFRAERLPSSVFLDPVRWPGLLSGNGTWNLEQNQGGWVVLLSFTGPQPMKHVGVRILVSRNGRSVGLWGEGEGVGRYEFRRREERSESQQ